MATIIMIVFILAQVAVILFVRHRCTQTKLMTAMVGPFWFGWMIFSFLRHEWFGFAISVGGLILGLLYLREYLKIRKAEKAS